MTYVPFNADIVVAGASNQAYRLNLDQGRFLAPFETSSTELASIVYNDKLNLICTGGIDGAVEFWSMDSKKRVMEIPTANPEMVK